MIRAVLQRAATCAPFPVFFTNLRSLGRGVAFDMQASALLELRAAIAREFANDLTPQDRQKFRPHVTIQNKVTPAEARALLDNMSRRFVPWHGQAEGLLLWRYLGGPWALEAEIPFRPHDPQAPIADSPEHR